jgi:class 3 adenylate cyclase/tetratricopeptide (TPR) repeat protein/tRNA A-37 threonylcarbamoyl transferase component Bud32
MMIGQQLGPYTILEEVGRGGMATVFRAYQATVERHVAVKVLHRAVVHDPELLERFRREARLIARLEHPHILPIYDFDGDHDPPYIVMRYLDSGTLKEVLERVAQGNAPLPLSEIGYLLRQVASALDYAHRQGIIHRDVKPSNIMLDREGNAFVTDLGIARLVSRQMIQVGGAITQTGATVGTPDYMAPEQAMGRGDIDQRADVYSLGVIVFQLLTGRMPFESDTPMGVMIKHIQEPPPSVTSLNPTLPVLVDGVMLKCLAKEPADRYATAGEAAAAVVEALGGGVVAVPTNLSAAAQAVAHHTQNRLASARIDTDTPSTPTEQQKQITVLYANLADFEEQLLADLGGDEAGRILQEWLHKVEGVAGQYGGMVHEKTANSFTAIWGVRAAREDDAERAVRAALHIKDELGRMKDELKDSSFILHPASLPIQIAVHSGAAVLARGDGLLSVSGPTVNLAGRLEQAAPEGSVVISQDTYSQVRGIFLVEGLEAVRVRGRREPIALYWVKGLKPRAHRARPPAVEGIETRTIGREAELKLLVEMMEAAREDDESQLVTVVGEAGMGKSRLLYELRDYEDKQPYDFWFFPGRGTPEMLGQPYALLRDVFIYRFEIQDSDAAALVQEKFERGVTRFLGTAAVDKAHLLAHLLGFQLVDSPYLRGQEAEQLRNQGVRVMMELFVAVATRRTSTSAGLWLELENVHWADERSLDLIQQLVAENPRLSLLVTCTARPVLFERRPGWGQGQDWHTRIDLRPLSRRDSRRLAREILQKVVDVPDGLRDLLVERSEGNPRYMEELVKVLVEDRVILRGRGEEDNWQVVMERLAQVRVPVTLAGLLQARLDRLLPEERVTLQRAAVVGRTFWDKSLKALETADHIPADIARALERLVRQELVSQREETTIGGTQEYAFKSSMLRDVVYEHILKRQQRAYHAAAADWLQMVSGERAGEYSAPIAAHYEQAGDVERAAAAWATAGNRAMQVSAFAEAKGFFQRGLALLPEQSPGRLGLLLRLGDSFTLLSNYAEAQVHLAAALALAQQMGDAGRAGAADASFYLGRVATLQGNFELAQRLMEDSVSLARTVGDVAALSRGVGGLGSLAWRAGKYGEATTYMEESLGLARTAGDINQVLNALNVLGITYMSQRRYREARPYLEEGIRLAEEVGNRARLGIYLNNLGEIDRFEGDLESAGQRYGQALVIAREAGMRQFETVLLLNLGSIALRLGDTAEAETFVRQALQKSLALGALPNVVATLGQFAEIRFCRGDTAGALALLGLALNHPAADSDLRVEAQALLDNLEEQVGAEGVTAGLEAGKALDWEGVIQELLVSQV